MKPQILKMNKAAKKALERIGYFDAKRSQLRELVSKIAALPCPHIRGGFLGTRFLDELRRLAQAKRRRLYRSDGKVYCPICQRVHRRYEEPRSCGEAWDYVCEAAFKERRALDALNALYLCAVFYEKGETGAYFDDKGVLTY